MLRRLFLILLITASVLAFSENSNAGERSFLSMTDLHFNPYAACAGSTPCPTVEKLRQADVSQWEAILAADDTTPIKLQIDSNYALLKSALAEFKNQTANKQIAFVVVLGDYLSHGFKKNYIKYASDTSDAAYQLFAKKTLQFVTQEIAATFPNMNVYMATGNNDSYQDDYTYEPNGAFFQDMSVAWSDLVKDERNKSLMRESFKTAGYYAVSINSNLRLIVLNTNLFLNKAKGTNVDQAANTELIWLDQALKNAKANNQKVLIIEHAPDSVDPYASINQQPFTAVPLFKPEYTDRYQSELQQYPGMITGILTAHFHMDGFQLLGANKIVVSSMPGVSSLFGNNPAYKIFSYNTETLQLTNYQTYFYDVTKQIGWASEYDFNQVYQPDCKDCKISDGMQRLQQTGDLVEKYKYYFSVETDSQPITTEWLPYWCQIYNVTVANYTACMGV